MKKLYSLLSFLLLAMMLQAQAPANYYDGTIGLTGAALKTKLSQIISNGAIDNGYGGLYLGYETTDVDHTYENDGTVLDMYSENPTGPDPYNYQVNKKKCGSYASEGDCYNREHVVPQSFFNSDSPMVSDINFIRPTDGKVNNMRNNYPFGLVSNPSFTSLNGTKVGTSGTPGYQGIVCEPIDEFKGDIARMIFYFVTRYESKLSTFKSGDMLGNTTYPGLTTWERDILVLWNTQDPVSANEIERNNASYAFQKNRNPFIDHPEWVQLIWGSQTADTEAPTPATNLTLSNTTTNSVDLSWTASTDNIGVAYYKVFVNGVFKVNSSSTNITVHGLKQGTSYNFYVVAVDAAGNESTQSNVQNTTTAVDTSAPTAPSSLEVVYAGTNNVQLKWTAATDNVAVTGYDIYANNVLVGSTSSTATNVANLTPTTTYTFYVIAKDEAENLSPRSNEVITTTLAVGSVCGDENFETIPPSASSYTTYNWSSNGISWSAEDARTDQMLNSRAITIRNGSLTAFAVPNGIGSLTVTTQLVFSGTPGDFSLFINDTDTGLKVPYGEKDVKTITTLNNINISGPVDIKLVNNSTKNRVIIDDMTWTCYLSAGTSEAAKDKNDFVISPNPIKNKEIKVTGSHLNQIQKVEIFDFTGKLVHTETRPFNNGNSISVKNLPAGIYILKADKNSAKFIIK